MAFVQSNSDQNIFMDDTMCINRDIVVNTVLKKPEIYHSTIKYIHIFFGIYFLECTKYDGTFISFNCFS